MANTVQGHKDVHAIDGSRVIANDGRTVVVSFPSGRSITEKPMVGHRVTQAPVELPDWQKIKKRF